MLYKLLAVARYRRAGNSYAVAAFFVNFGQLLAHNFNRVALVGSVVRIEYLVIFIKQAQLCGGGAAVYTEVCFAAVFFNIRVFNR